MKFLFLIVFLILIAYNLDTHGQTQDLKIQDSANHTSTSFDSKIHPILKKWQTSENPEKFALQNNLYLKDNTIRVYIYLINENFTSFIESEVDIVSTYKNIVVSFVTSEQLDKLSVLEIVEKITPPELARTPPIPTPSPPQTQTSEEIPKQTLDDYLVWIILSGIVISIIFIYKYKSTNKKIQSI